ncbi:MAG: hypothetical protein WBF53_13840 [Litorimonas sp.]
MLPALRLEVNRAEDRARPATAAEILTELELLESRYHRMDHDAGTAKALARQWVEDLQGTGIPIGHLRDRCKAWRMSDNAFAPRSAGQLLGGKDGAWLASYAMRLRGALDRIETETHADVLTDAEIEALEAAGRQERLQAEAQREVDRLLRKAQTDVADAKREIEAATTRRDQAVERIDDLTTLSKTDLKPAMATLYAAIIRSSEQARDESVEKIESARERLREAEEALAAFEPAETAA